MSDTKGNDKPASQPIAITDAQFEEVVMQSDLPVVVDFWAPWCGPCRTIAPALEQLAGEFAGRVRVVKVDVDTNKQWLDKLGIRGIPHLLYVHDGKVLDRSVGGQPRAKLHTAFESFLQKVGSHRETAHPDAQTAFEEAVTAAEKRRSQRSEAAGAAFQSKAKAEFDEAEASRIAFDALVNAEMADLRKQVADGTLSQEDFDVRWREASARLWDDPRCAAERQRRERAIQALNSGRCEAFKQEFFAEIAAAEEEYDRTVDAARAKLEEARRAGKQ